MNKTALAKFYDDKKSSYQFEFVRGSLYDKVRLLVTRGSKVLDVGCANGFFSKALVSKNCAVYGIEVSPGMAKNAKKILTRVVVGNIEELTNPYSNEKFDTILLMDVLEHLFNPPSVLSKLKKKLTKKGTVIITLPNIAYWKVRWELSRGRFNYEDSGILDSGHIRFFTYDTAVKMFKDQGFEIVSSDCVTEYPLLLLKIRNRWKHLDFEPLLKRLLPRVVAYQYIFLIRPLK